MPAPDPRPSRPAGPSSRPPGPLEGVVVVAVEQAVAAPFATRQLADLGARVIKVERPGQGDFARGYDSTVLGQSSHFVWLNRGKESVTLDLKAEKDRYALERLIGRADVLVQNLAPSAAERMGITAAQVVERHPRVVACDISGYGAGGPYSERKAYDLLIQCEAGFVSVTGTPEYPAKAGIAVADIAAGMYAYSGVLAALHQRERTGEGQALEVSMLEALGEWMGFPYLYACYGGSDPVRAGASHATIAPYGPVTTSTGDVLTLAIQNEREWERFCADVLERPELATDERFAGNAARNAHRDELAVVVDEVFATLTADEARRRLDEAGIANAVQRTMGGFAEHPQLSARDRWRDTPTPGGAVRMPLPPVTSGWAEPDGAVPEAGEHTDQVLAWLDAGPESGIDSGSDAGIDAGIDAGRAR